MTLRETNLRIFEHKPVDGVFFQPRFEPWFFWHGTFDSLPERCRGKTVKQVYEDLDVSNRYFAHFTGLAVPVETRYSPAVRRKETVTDEDKTVVVETPHGDLVERRVMTVDRIWRKVDFAVKTVDDLDKVQWLYENCSTHFNARAFAHGDEYEGDRGWPQFNICPSPYEVLTQEWMTFEDFIYALADVPQRMERVMEAIDRSYDPLFEELPGHDGVRIVCFPENIHAMRSPPSYFERYLIPWYGKRCGQLRDAGIYTHIHMDGDVKPLLKYLADLPFDGLEAVTPLPQGDVSLAEIREHIGDKVLLDGIPAVLFLDHYSRDHLQECVEKVVELFHPRLVLGISDELPQGGNDESFQRLCWTADYCRSKKI